MNKADRGFALLGDELGARRVAALLEKRAREDDEDKREFEDTRRAYIESGRRIAEELEIPFDEEGFHAAAMVIARDTGEVPSERVALMAMKEAPAVVPN